MTAISWMTSPAWILELDRGRGIPYEGNYSAWLDQKAKRMSQEAREDKSKQKALEKELEWIRVRCQAPASPSSKARIWHAITRWPGQTVLRTRHGRRRSSSPTANVWATR